MNLTASAASHPAHHPSRLVLATLMAALLAFAVQAQAARNEDQLLAQEKANKAAAARSGAASAAAASTAASAPDTHAAAKFHEAVPSQRHSPSNSQ